MSFTRVRLQLGKIHKYMMYTIYFSIRLNNRSEEDADATDIAIFAMCMNIKVNVAMHIWLLVVNVTTIVVWYDYHGT